MRRLGSIAAALLAIIAIGLILLQLRIPLRQEIRLAQPKKTAALPLKAESSSGGVDINHADIQELQRLPGIGPATAQRIIEERNTNGLFAYPEDLISVSGIGERTLQKLRDEIQINK